MSTDSNLYELTVLEKNVWTPNLFSFKTTRPADFRFDAGQFARLGMRVDEIAAAPKEAFVPKEDGNANDAATDDDAPIFRAYSIVSSPFDETLEFFSVVVPEGAFTSRLQYLDKGDTLYLDPTPYGFLTLARFQQPAPQDLWLLATGTGLAPFLSILNSLDAWQNYARIVLAFSVRYAADLAYLDDLTVLGQTMGEMVKEATGRTADFVFIPIITRQTADAKMQVQGALTARLPKLIASGELAAAAGFALDPNTAHVMLCGNPQMVDDTKEALKAQGLIMNRRGVGNIAVENYW